MMGSSIPSSDCNDIMAFDPPKRITADEFCVSSDSRRPDRAHQATSRRSSIDLPNRRGLPLPANQARRA